MKNTKRVMAQFTFYDRTGIQKMLEKKAQQGWMLEKIGSYAWKFRRIEPAKIHFAVTYFPNASQFDPHPSEEQQRLWDFCEHTGWHLAASNAQLQVFYNEAENPVPIETDPQIELENIHRTMNKSVIPSYILLIFIGFLMLIMNASLMSMDTVHWLTSNANLVTSLCWSVIILMMLIEITGYFVWHEKAWKAIQTDGSFVATKGFRKVQLALMWFVLGAVGIYMLSINKRLAVLSLVSVVTLGIVWAVVFGVKNLLKKLDTPANVNKVITIITAVIMSFGMAGFGTVFIVDKAMQSGFLDTLQNNSYKYEHNGHTFTAYTDTIPLNIYDIVQTDTKEFSTIWDFESSVMVSEGRAYQSPLANNLGDYTLSYSVVEIKLPFLYNIVYKGMYKDFLGNPSLTVDTEAGHDAMTINAEEWHADRAFRFVQDGYPTSHYLLCYDRHIVEIHFDQDMKIDQNVRDTVAQKLADIPVE